MTVEFGSNWRLLLSPASHEHTVRGVVPSCRDVDGDQNRTSLRVSNNVDFSPAARHLTDMCDIPWFCSSGAQCGLQ